MRAGYAGDGQHAGSYYAASANPSPQRPPLDGAQEVDVCVVGAGYSGLSTALHLAEKGHQVAVVEGARVGWGASGRNGGQIVNGLNASLQTIERRYGPQTASFVAGLVQEGGEIIRERVRRYYDKTDMLASYRELYGQLVAAPDVDMALKGRRRAWLASASR